MTGTRSVMQTYFERFSAGALAVAVFVACYLAYDRLSPAGVPAETAVLEQTSHGATDGHGRLENLLPPRRPKIKREPTDSVLALSKWFAELDYDLDHIQERGAAVPHAYLASLPPDLSRVRETKRRKQLFFKAVLPLILRANQEILDDRRRLWQLRSDQRLGRVTAAEDRLWLAAMAERYGTDRGNLDALLLRVDVVPPSLALAQAAEESGWGSSRFARQGNAIFGQWTTAKGVGLVPLEREADKDHLVRAFDTLFDSVRAYMRNLNSHRAYRELRHARTMLRRSGEPLDGLSLARYLHRYSERGQDYVNAVQAMIRANGLNRLDDARLAGGASPEA